MADGTELLPISVLLLLEELLELLEDELELEEELEERDLFLVFFLPLCRLSGSADWSMIG